MSTKVSVKAVRHWLTIIANSKKDSCYTNGIRLFLKKRNRRTITGIKRVCEQIKEVVISDEAFSIDVFGEKATLFFKELDIENIDPDGR